MKTVSVIGLGLSINDLTDSHLKLIHKADILIGGKRHLEFFKNTACTKKEITKDLKAVIEFINQKRKDNSIVVLASGDPLFYGIGSLLIKSLGSENICIYPNITSIGAAFSRIKESWHDAHIISLHGQYDEQEFVNALEQQEKIALLTEPKKNPAWVAGFLIKTGNTDFNMCVIEQMGTDAEIVKWYDLKQAAEKEFSDPNVVILKRSELKTGQKESLNQFYPGMPDNYYEHENGLITKSEVRAVTLSKLRLYSPGHVLWDLGAGSGSVAVESSLFITKGKIFAVEQNPDRIKQIQINKDKSGVKNLEIIHARLPEGLENLPRPDRVFIGGGGKNLEQIIKTSAGYLNKNGIIVVNTVLLQNIETAITTFQDTGLKTEIIQVQISSGKEMPWSQRLQAYNPVWIITGTAE
ncbi:Cobalamin biosynthesis bifunctional protein [Desulfonema limicola]|uniref:Cobalamin biosynthesis bifunctional protein n=1 Tax=Desulfonema limicola TaxID=45656 RepID=A0A975BCW6_9BACT|nr:precorrin-6y C5,15-methyltransferase (decarboxylating) subunit CbiE [Desulfonema limicola]QTA83061.1 Cobalamin biosynthesis bifunctional protein [Desulfonema limicola]